MTHMARRWIHALARFGDGLPANVLPLAVNEVTQVGLEAIAAAFSYGASGLRLLLRAKPRHDVAGLTKTLALAEPILAGLGFSRAAPPRSRPTIPMRSAQRCGIAAAEPAPRPASFLPVGGKREVLRLALRELHRVAPAPADVVALPAGAPFGAVEINVAGCTLCLACVSACPTGALIDDPSGDAGALRRCLRAVRAVQGDLPEQVISLKPQLDFRAATPPRASEGGGAVSLHPLRQSRRRQEHH